MSCPPKQNNMICLSVLLITAEQWNSFGNENSKAGSTVSLDLLARVFGRSLLKSLNEKLSELTLSTITGQVITVCFFLYLPCQVQLYFPTLLFHVVGFLILVFGICLSTNKIWSQWMQILHHQMQIQSKDLDSPFWKKIKNIGTKEWKWIITKL